MLESFLSAIAGEPATRPVWTADISYWLSGRKQKAGTADRTLKTEEEYLQRHAEPDWNTEEGYLQLHTDLGILPYYYYEKFWVFEAEYDDRIEEVVGTSESRGFREIRTPTGTLREESAFLPESSCVGITKHMVQNEAELDILLYVLERRTLVPRNLHDYPERMKLWARYDGLPCLGLPRSPLPALAYEWCGLEGLVLLLLDCRDRTEAALSLLEEQEKPVLDAVCDLAPPLVHFPDNLSSDNLTGYYDQYMRDHHAERLDKLHAAGIAAAVHLDGTVRGLLPKLIETGFDAVEALTPAPAGDANVEEIAGLAEGGRTTIWGGVPGVMFAPPYTWDDVEQHVARVLRTWQGRPFVLGVADQVPPDGDIEYCRRIREMVDRQGTEK